jgi:hypothetical protein
MRLIFGILASVFLLTSCTQETQDTLYTQPKEYFTEFHNNPRPTIPDTGHHPWWTRNSDNARKDGWDYFADGPGLIRFVWDNFEFEGMPRIDTTATPNNYRNNETGCGVPGAVKYLGIYVIPPKLNRKVWFVPSTCRDSVVTKPRTLVRLFVNGELIAGHQTKEWALQNGLAGIDPRFYDILAERQNYKDLESHDDQTWCEIISRKFDFEEGEIIDLEIDFAVKEWGNNFAIKFLNTNLPYFYHMGELMSPDLAYPDHTFVYPTEVKKGEKVLVSWWTTRHPTVLLNGKDVGNRGHKEVEISTRTHFDFSVGKKKYSYNIEVVE